MSLRLPLLHDVVRFTLPPDEVGDLLAADFGHTAVRDLQAWMVRGVCDGVREPDEHMRLLRQDVLVRGFHQPAIVRCVAGTRILVEGHHRCVLGFELGMPVPALLVDCTHRVNESCPDVVTLRLAQWESKQTTAWDWRRLLSQA